MDNENMRADAHGHANIDAALNATNAQMYKRITTIGDHAYQKTHAGWFQI